MARPVGLGCMRVRDPAVVTAALDAGVTLLDTADGYGDAAGENEKLIAAVRRPGVTVVTKGGLVRDGARYVADGRARHLEAAAAASRARLGTIDLYLLHAVDRRVPLATSVRALARLVERGVVARVGLSNVTRTQLEQAAAIVEISAVEVALSPHDVTAVRGGVLSWCADRGILLLAHRPFGGPDGARRLARDPALTALAERHATTPHALALAWLRSLGPVVVPLPGASRVETAVHLNPGEVEESVLQELGARFLEHVPFRGVGAKSRAVSGSTSSEGSGSTTSEVVVVMGMPGAGKTRWVGPMVEAGAVRLNRDERGGRLDGLVRGLDDALTGGAARVVLDNTYATRSSRAPVIAAARRHGASVRCVWLDTAIEDAQVNAAARVLERHGRLLEPAELAAAGEPGPSAQFGWRRQHEPPSTDEGFDAVERTPFARTPESGGRRAVILELGALDAEATPTITRWREAGWVVVATAWQRADAPADVDVAVCPHPAGPPVCWCRKPLPGLGLVLARRHGLDISASVHVGRGAADRGFAARLGLRFVDVGAWLAGEVVPESAP